MVALREFVKRNDMKTGYSWDGRDGSERRHFAFTDPGGPESAETFPALMAAMRWPVTVDDAGNVVGIEFRGEKQGDELKLFETIARYVYSDSYILVAGEHGWSHRWEFDGRRLITSDIRPADDNW